MIRGLYKTDVVTITEDKTIKEAATLMRDRNVGDVVVVSTREGNTSSNTDVGMVPIGILTDRDIVVKCIAEGPHKLNDIHVRDVMSTNIAFIKEDVGLFDTIRRMREAGVGRILVVDDKKKLMGILTSQTIFDLLNDELHELGMIARSRRAGSTRSQADDVRLPPNLTPDQAQGIRH